MFLDEARVAANLHHQHIVQVHDIGESDGEFFIAMEYIHGEDVRSILSAASKRRAHVPLGLAVAVVSAAASGLHYAHERRGNDRRPLGIVHRDISPSNILVGYDGSIKVLDFGIAKASMRSETRSGSLKGKISYMSPEQLKGAAIDRRSDVYSLGVVLYELATTTRLFKGESDYMVMDQIVNGRVSLPQVRRPDLPNELSAIIMRAIAPDPERRYFTAEELRVAIDQFANKTGLTASTSAIGGYLRKQFGDRPEPWLELEAQGIYSFDDLQKPPEEGAPNNTWTEMPATDERVPRHSSQSLPRMSGRMSIGPTTSASETPVTVPPPVRLPSTPPPTDSKMGWESQRPASRGFTPARVAMICAPLIAILVFLLWKLQGSDGAPQVAVTPPPPAPVAAAAPSAPVVTPLPEPPKPAAVAPAPETAAPEPPRNVESRRTVQASAPRKSGSAKSVETPAEPAPKAPPVPTTSLGPTQPPAPIAPPVQQAAVALSTPPAVAAPVAATPPPAAAPAPTAAPPPTPAIAVPAATQPAAPSNPGGPTNVVASALDANRSAGTKEIDPDSKTKVEMSRAGTDKITGRFRLCVGPDGGVSSVSVLKGTGFSNYDDRIQSTIRNQWRFKPFLTNGKPGSVCSVVSFVYAQQR